MLAQLIPTEMEAVRMDNLTDSDMEYMQPHYGWLSPEGEYHQLTIIHTHERYIFNVCGLEVAEAEAIGWVHLSRSSYYHASMGNSALADGKDKRLTSAQTQWLRKCGYDISRIDPCIGKIE